MKNTVGKSNNPTGLRDLRCSLLGKGKSFRLFHPKIADAIQLFKLQPVQQQDFLLTKSSGIRRGKLCIALVLETIQNFIVAVKMLFLACRLEQCRSASNSFVCRKRLILLNTGLILRIAERSFRTKTFYHDYLQWQVQRHKQFITLWEYSNAQNIRSFICRTASTFD